jgi:hypothetical protein
MVEPIAENPSGQSEQTPIQAGPAWREGLAPELKVEKSLDVFKGKDWNEVGPLMAKSYVEGQKMIGGSIRIPKDDAKPEEWDAIFNKLGRPESPDKYELVLPNPEYIEWNQDRINAFKARMHKAGYTSKQVQEAIHWYSDALTEDFQAKKTSFETAVNTLRTEWGGAFDRNLALAKKARDLYGGPEAKEFFKDDALGNNPVLIKMLARMASDLEEGDYLGGLGETTGMGSDEAKAKIAEVMANKDDLYHAKFQGKPGHDERVQEVQGWYAQAYNAI